MENTVVNFFGIANYYFFTNKIHETIEHANLTTETKKHWLSLLKLSILLSTEEDHDQLAILLIMVLIND